MTPRREGTCCWECKHIFFSVAEADWSDVTPGDDFGLECLKRHWRLDTHHDNAPTMGRYLRMAEQCADFTSRPAAQR